ncbi:AraC family transcriptional regulator [Actinocorallia sp. API 0066]|uniref:helix-turn-helix transcriptional regulator n=1 Tax=Actinocorallia sp. API 0066 TaxID=2896846 RepID=UPI001E4F9669|nr:AraC family transcriptional regulator [Actinocorallia sp. API 0066]MCD0449246.1 AraC family transcriptional regulator [Actinocorallia sp. API 0066]
MLRTRRLAETGGIVLADIAYAPPHGGWSEAAPEPSDALCLVRSGWFARRALGREEFVDATGGYVARAGVEERIAGEAAGLTWIRLSPDAYDTHASRACRARDWLLRTDAVFDLQHRRLLAAVRRGADATETAERIFLLLAALPHGDGVRGPRPRPATWAAHRALVADAQEALHHRPGLGLPALAAAVGASPHHLSRVFRRVTGRTITVYRNELRVRRMLDALADGHRDLAALAADLGFADHAEMTRTTRQHLGQPPSHLRTALALE